MKQIALTNFAVAQPNCLYPQQALLHYTAWLLAASRCAQENITSKEAANKVFLDTQKDVQKYGVSPSYIKQRQACVFPSISPTKGKTLPEPPLIIPNIKNSSSGLDIKERMFLYSNIVFDMFQQLYAGDKAKPNEIIHATCSGYISPSPAQDLVMHKDWNDTMVTHCYHMGCYAAIPALRMAVGRMATSQLLSQQEVNVDVVHTELLSLHFDAIRHDIEHIINMTLFSDGFIRYTTYLETNPILKELGGLKVLAFLDEIIPNTTKEMGWVINTHQFDMTLSKNVPLFLRDNIQSFVNKLCHQAGFEFADKKKALHFAIHPGGPKIVDYIQDELGLTNDQVQVSRDVLYNNGNMSSATLPHIWQNIIANTSIKPHTKIISIAFGPGLTAAGIVFEKI